MKRLIITTILLLLSGCSSNRIERKIAERINLTCRSASTCAIKIKELTDFEWDRMYVFDYRATKDQINQALGTPLPNYTEFTRRIIFLKDGKIVYSEDGPTNIEAPVNGEVIFDIPSTEVYKSYLPDTIFRAEKKKFENGVYYNLTQVK